MEDEEISLEKAEFIEARVAALSAYVIECLDRARTEGNNVLQWLFGVITGGIGIIGTLGAKGYYEIAGGFLCAVIAASFAAVRLVRGLRSRATQPPGNYAAALNKIRNDSFARMKWREAIGIDGRISSNLKEVESLTAVVDNARERFARIPAWFIGGTIAAYVIKICFF